MKSSLVCLLLLVSLWTQTSHGQIDLRLETAKEAYLQFAPVPVTVRIKNQGADEVRLASEEGRPWLEFVVQRSDGMVVQMESPPPVADRVVKIAESFGLAIDLAPSFMVRETGGYTVRASLRLPSGEKLLTEPLRFMISRGEVIWTVPRGEGAERRVYSLIKYFEDPNVGLYLRVEVPEKNLVYPCRRLGPYLPLAKPTAEFDEKNHLHLLYATDSGMHRVTVVNGDGAILREENRQEGVDRPKLVRLPNGEVVTEGGVVILPSNLRERLSNLQARVGATPPPSSTPAVAP